MQMWVRLHTDVTHEYEDKCPPVREMRALLGIRESLARTVLRRRCRLMVIIVVSVVIPQKNK